MIKKEIYDSAFDIRQKLHKLFNTNIYSESIAIFYAIAELKEELNIIRKEIKMAKKKAVKKTAKKTVSKKK